ncbi:MAG: endonuclease III [Candidatus Altiarchaeota archaeon]|nr:endonuclease III [Candidatus Altiarchaeota archaeon]
MILAKNMGNILKKIDKVLGGKAYVHELKDPFRVLISTILSARTKDEVTEEVSEVLFSQIKGPKDLINLPTPELEKIIKKIGFFRTKAKHLKETANLVLEYGGVPDTIQELVKLPGVGRKTANLVVAVAFDKPGLCVDTHVHRIPNRWGLISTKTPLQTEMTLRDMIPQKYWREINRVLVPFGKFICKPIKPTCGACPLSSTCPKVGVKT